MFVLLTKGSKLLVNVSVLSSCHWITMHNHEVLLGAAGLYNTIVLDYFFSLT